jgi:hypothetical protein
VTLFGLGLLVAIVVEATIHTFLIIYFTTKFSGEGKSSPFVVFSEGVVVSKNVVSESILKETLAELKLEEDASHSFASNQAPSQAEQTPAEARAKKRELFKQLFRPAEATRPATSVNLCG